MEDRIQNIDRNRIKINKTMNEMKISIRICEVNPPYTVKQKGKRRQTIFSLFKWVLALYRNLIILLSTALEQDCNYSNLQRHELFWSANSKSVCERALMPTLNFFQRLSPALLGIEAKSFPMFYVRSISAGHSTGRCVSVRMR